MLGETAISQMSKRHLNLSRQRARSPVRTRAAVTASAMLLFANPRLRAEDRVDYRYEDYAEENGRIHVQTHGAFFEASLTPWLSLKGNYIYDAIGPAVPARLKRDQHRHDR